MFRAKATEMLRCGFCSLDKLKKIKKKERLAKESAVISSPPALADIEPFNPALANQLANFDPSNPHRRQL